MHFFVILFIVLVRFCVVSNDYSNKEACFEKSPCLSPTSVVPPSDWCEKAWIYGACQNSLDFGDSSQSRPHLPRSPSQWLLPNSLGAAASVTRWPKLRCLVVHGVAKLGRKSWITRISRAMLRHRLPPLVRHHGIRVDMAMLMAAKRLRDGNPAGEATMVVSNLKVVNKVLLLVLPSIIRRAIGRPI